MNALSPKERAQHVMRILSILMLSPDAGAQLAAMQPAVLRMNKADFDHLLSVANSNHVVIRGFVRLRDIWQHEGDSERMAWAEQAVSAESIRISKALDALSLILQAFEAEGLDVTVMKSLDHWPDFGSDIDLYTNASAQRVCSLMNRRFNARLAAQSWGDKLASKWNFNLPGLNEAVEVHAGRLGQTGEQLILASQVPTRARVMQYNQHSFRVPSPSDRIMISTLQRMYRHFYFRLCDIVDSADLVTSGAVDFLDLRRAAQKAGIWEGVATYLLLVSDYVRAYRGEGVALPAFVEHAARFQGDAMYVGGLFLRVPIMPQSINLYRMQWLGLIKRRELRSGARLGLLPWLATAAAIGQKITGSDKGIW